MFIRSNVVNKYLTLKVPCKSRWTIPYQSVDKFIIPKYAMVQVKYRIESIKDPD